jgi:aspartate/methionine/tyrosine aminotransferase
MGAPYANELEIVTFHTVSKGVYGECGMRGGAMELMNIEQRYGFFFHFRFLEVWREL